MDVIGFLQEENTRLRNLIGSLITNYSTLTRDEVFASVREICDATVNHLDKQHHLLLERLRGKEGYEDLFHRINAARSAVADEVGRLVEVHVDEPEYRSCLADLLKTLERHAAVSDEFYRHVASTLSSPEWDAINESFKAHIFQTGATAEQMTTTHGIQDISIHDR